MAEQMKHTPGPWFADSHGNIWRRPPGDLYQYGGSVAGDRPIASASKGFYHDGATGYPTEANARLIAAAPELLAACEAMFKWDEAEKTHAVNHYVRMALCEDAFSKARDAIAKATGETP